MSRLAKKPIPIPEGIEVHMNDRLITIKGKKGELVHTLHPAVAVAYTDNHLCFSLCALATKHNKAQLGTACSLVRSMVVGVTEGFTKKLQLVGVGYRAQVKEQTVIMNLGYSHPVDYKLPLGITVECPTQTEIVLEGIDKQLVGQVAADLRACRPPETYKGKGVRYADEVVRIKEAKKK